jgi:hypothetical protein
MPKILTAEEKIKRAKDKYNKSKKGKEATKRYKANKSSIDGLQDSTKEVFVDLKESKGYTADQLLRELLGLA